MPLAQYKGIQTGRFCLAAWPSQFGSMEIKIMTSEFLTNIAKGFNDKIEHVRFEKLEPGHLGRVNASGDRDGYRILIDRGKLRCSFQTFFVLFHEIAHIELFHVGYRFYLADENHREGREKEADEWAFKQLGVVKSNGYINDTDRVCFQCLQSIPKHCSKGLPLE